MKKQHLRSFDNWKLNESIEEKDGIIKRLSDKVKEAIDAEYWIDANNILRTFIEENKGEIEKANGMDVITALEPWYDTYKEDWENVEKSEDEESLQLSEPEEDYSDEEEEMDDEMANSSDEESDDEEW